MLMIKLENNTEYPSELPDEFPGSQKRVQISHGERTIAVGVTEVTSTCTVWIMETRNSIEFTCKYEGVSIKNQPIPFSMDRDGHDSHALFQYMFYT